MLAGFAKGWPRDKAPELDAEAEKAIAALLPRLATDSRGQMLGLASRWGVKGLDGHVAELAKDLLAAAADASKSDAARIDAARQLIDLRKSDPQAARDVIALVTAKTAARGGERPDRRRATQRRRPRWERPSSMRWGR